MPPEPLFPAAAERGIRWVSYDRPGYGGSSPHHGRDAAFWERHRNKIEQAAKAVDAGHG